MMVLVMNQVAARRCLTRQRRRFEAVGTLVCTIGQNRPARFSIRPKSHLSLVQYAGCIEKERSISCLEKLNEQAASALLSLEPGDLSYCLKLAKRFEHMGIESDQASNALCTLVESGELETIYQAG